MSSARTRRPTFSAAESLRALLGDRQGGPDVTAYTTPARAQHLSGPPRTYLEVGSVETFRDEVIDYAQRLSRAGVSVDLHLWGGGFHSFEFFAPHPAISREAVSAREMRLRRALAD